MDEGIFMWQAMASLFVNLLTKHQNIWSLFLCACPKYESSALIYKTTDMKHVIGKRQPQRNWEREGLNRESERHLQAGRQTEISKQAGRQIGRTTDRQTCTGKQADKKDRQAERQVDRQNVHAGRHKQTGRQRNMCRQAERDRQIDRCAGRQTDR